MFVVFILIFGLYATGFFDEILFYFFSDVFDLLECLFQKIGGDWFEK